MEATSHLRLANDITRGPVPISPWKPGSANLFSKLLQQINESAWELWFAQGFSSDGEAAFAIGFFRDGALAVKKGGFRVEVHALFRDTTYTNCELLFPETTVVEDVQGRVVGTWTSRNVAGKIVSSATFDMPCDLSTVRLEFDVASKVSGHVVLTPAFSNLTSVETPLEEDQAKLGPEVFYLRPLPLAHVMADLTFGETGSTNTLRIEKGLGRVDRVWSALSWPMVMSKTFHLSASVGPYRVHVARIISTVADGQIPHSSARIFRQDELVCNPQDVVVEFFGIDGNGEGLRGDFKNKSTGCRVVLIQNDERWEFDVCNLKTMWNIPIGINGAGNAGFLVRVKGGLVGKDQTDTVAGFGTCAYVDL